MHPPQPRATTPITTSHPSAPCPTHRTLSMCCALAGQRCLKKIVVEWLRVWPRRASGTNAHNRTRAHTFHSPTPTAPPTASHSTLPHFQTNPIARHPCLDRAAWESLRGIFFCKRGSDSDVGEPMTQRSHSLLSTSTPPRLVPHPIANHGW